MQRRRLVASVLLASSSTCRAYSILSTPVAIPRSRVLLEHNSPMLFVGSCFGENIFSLLKDLKFSHIASNPQGIAFNPVSIAVQLENSLKKRIWIEDDLAISPYASDIVFGYDHHTSFSGLVKDKVEVIKKMNSRTSEASKILTDAKDGGFVFLTLGTAKTHTLLSNGRVVSNCHKQPSSLFTSSIMTVDQVVGCLASAIALLPPKVHVVLTVSPVRHTRETLQVNSLSKAVLRVACSTLCERFPQQVSYFPSFEIMTDELRDYRFYEKDLIHPNDVAKDVLFERFSSTFFSPECATKCEEIKGITAMYRHRVGEALAESLEYKSHCRRLVERMLLHDEALFREELEDLQSRFIN